MSAFLRAQIVAIRESARALAAQADALIAVLDRPPAGGSPADGCQHPAAARLVAAIMGAPNRTICGACGAEMEGGG